MFSKCPATSQTTAHPHTQSCSRMDNGHFQVILKIHGNMNMKYDNQRCKILICERWLPNTLGIFISSLLIKIKILMENSSAFHPFRASSWFNKEHDRLCVRYLEKYFLFLTFVWQGAGHTWSDYVVHSSHGRCPGRWQHHSVIHLHPRYQHHKSNVCFTRTA